MKIQRIRLRKKNKMDKKKEKRGNKSPFNFHFVSIRQTPSCKCHEVFSENLGDFQRYL